jgi:hypothetical protein
MNLPQTPTIFMGDSVRVTATVGTINGQPVLTAPVINTAVLPGGTGVGQPDTLAAAVAASAQNGTLDAAQVAASGTVTAIVQVGGPNQDRVITITDGGGTVDIRIDFKVSGGSQPFVVNDVIRVRGVLVPTPLGKWEIKPRSLAEIVKTN